MERIGREDMFFQIAQIVAERGTCPRARVGSVIVRENRIISIGYNGAPPGMPHCDEVGCELGNRGIATFREDAKLPYPPGCERAIHAEANALAFAARSGVATKGAHLYCTHGPCYTCAKLMLSAGISVVHYITPYRDDRGHDLLVAGGCTIFTHARLKD